MAHRGEKTGFGLARRLGAVTRGGGGAQLPDLVAQSLELGLDRPSPQRPPRAQKPQPADRGERGEESEGDEDAIGNGGHAERPNSFDEGDYSTEIERKV